jgi:UDP-perosamine 4-acetyltransferase
VVGIGAGGHAKVVLDVLKLAGGSEVVGLLDRDAELWGKRFLGVPVLGGDELLSGLRCQKVDFAFIGVGSTGDTRPRRRLYEMAREYGLTMLQAIHPNAVVSSSASLCDGVSVMAGAIINPDARLGSNVVVNTGALVEHDCILEDHVYVATGAHLGGSVHVGEGAHVGMGASVRQGVRIGRGSIVGAGAAVVEDVPDNVVVVGVPARILRTCA